MLYSRPRRGNIKRKASRGSPRQSQTRVKPKQSNAISNRGRHLGAKKCYIVFKYWLRLVLALKFRASGCKESDIMSSTFGCDLCSCINYAHLSATKCHTVLNFWLQVTLVQRFWAPGFEKSVIRTENVGLPLALAIRFWRSKCEKVLYRPQIIAAIGARAQVLDIRV